MTVRRYTTEPSTISSMRKYLGYVWLALASALLTSTVLQLAFGLNGSQPGMGIILALGLAARWPLALMALAVLVAPRSQTECSNQLEHSDRTWFAKFLVAMSLALFVASPVLQLI